MWNGSSFVDHDGREHGARSTTALQVRIPPVGKNASQPGIIQAYEAGRRSSRISRFPPETKIELILTKFSTPTETPTWYGQPLCPAFTPVPAASLHSGWGGAPGNREAPPRDGTAVDRTTGTSDCSTFRPADDSALPLAALPSSSRAGATGAGATDESCPGQGLPALGLAGPWLV